jgi:hypothetical protein
VSVCVRAREMNYRLRNTQFRPFLLEVDVIKANHSDVSATFLRDKGTNIRSCEEECM